MVTHTYNTSTQKTEAGRALVGGQPGLHSKTLSQKKIQTPVLPNLSLSLSLSLHLA
jgi:hypothetical protein